MTFDLITMHLEAAMEQPDCPICRRRADVELGYIRSLLGEHLNDPTTRAHIVASLGFCAFHVWQINTIEVNEYGNVLQTLRLYQQLASIAQSRLTQYAEQALKGRVPVWQRWLRQTFLLGRHLPEPTALKPHVQCRVCQFGDEAVQTGLEWLIKGLSAPQGEFRERYSGSDGLCLPHLRQVLTLANRSTRSGAAFIVDDCVRRLAALQTELDELAEQEIKKLRRESHYEDGNGSWRHTLTFFGGNPHSDQGSRKSHISSTELSESDANGAFEFLDNDLTYSMWSALSVNMVS